MAWKLETGEDSSNPVPWMVVSWYPWALALRAVLSAVAMPAGF
jgi:hypothetical protein